METLESVQQSTPFEFDPSGIPQCQVNTLMAAVTAGISDFYSQPENELKFKEWRQKKAYQRVYHID